MGEERDERRQMLVRMGGGPMTRRARKADESQGLAPEWPERLTLAPAPEAKPASSIVLFLGHLKDGRHVAAELHVAGREVVDGTILCASRYAREASVAWGMCAKARLMERREYTATERAANTRQGKGVALEDITHGEAVSIARVGTKSVATRLSLDGLKVVELKVIAEGDALYAWAEAHSWAQRNLLPRERR